MERTNQKECPKCKSRNIIDSGSRIGDMSKIEPGRPIPDANHPIYECKDCGELFILLGSKQD